MKITLKKVLALFGAVALGVTMLQTPTEVRAAVSDKTVKKAYISYLKEKMENSEYEVDIDYTLYDFNKDGIKELVVSYAAGARGTYEVYTYSGKKVVELVSGENDIGYIKGKKYIVTYGSGGAGNYGYTVYKIKSGKLVEVNKYDCVDGDYQKNGETITQKAFSAFEKKVITNLGKSSKLARIYYSPEELGIGGENPDKKCTTVTKATNKKIYYYYYKLGNEQVTIWKSKTKSAKITSETKFYYGNKELLFSGKLSGINIDTKMWIREISKKEFIEKMKDYDGTFDRIFIKDGKVEKVFINIQTVA